MKKSNVTKLRCPACKEALHLETNEAGPEIIMGKLICACGQTYLIENGVPNLVYPAQLLPSDAEFQQKYDDGAERYDSGMEWLFNAFFEDEQHIRTQMIELLDIKPGSRVLDLGCGTGGDSSYIAPIIGPTGELFALDLSRGMIEIAKGKLAHLQTPIEYCLSNAAYLPFADNTFDALLHFGGLNVFGEIKKALAEMTRIVRPGGKVVVGDEGVAPWLQRKLFGRILIKANPLYKHKPPLHLLPVTIQDVCLRWFFGNAFYLIDYRVSETPSQFNLDLPIPGKGDTLRSRYYGSTAKN